IENAKLIFTAARHPKNFISLYGADHLLSRVEDADYVADIINSWVNRYMSGEKAVLPTEEDDLQEVTVTESGEGKFTQIVHAAGHTFVVDEPIDGGGDNKGPGPYDLLLASLGACTSITLRLYAEHKNIPLKRVKVSLSREKIYNDDLVNCVEANARLDLINRTITVTGDLTPEERDGLFRISEKCPVHKTLSRPSVIKTRLKTEKL
ncbi:MAG TPA: OsmC family protein, partial [Alphaproteobacteria bacterium]|nr:OsmC family protein [Alphaproteobacteria bacterium]